MFHSLWPVRRSWISLSVSDASGGTVDKSRSGLPEDIRQFLLQHIDSIAKLEALLLLKSRPDQVWSPDLLARRLYIATVHSSQILANLSALGFCRQLGTAPPQYQYQPGTAEVQSLLDRLAELYSSDLIAITQLVHQHAKGVEQFSDAFRLKQDPEA